MADDTTSGGTPGPQRFLECVAFVVGLLSLTVLLVPPLHGPDQGFFGRVAEHPLAALTWVTCWGFVGYLTVKPIVRPLFRRNP